MNFWYRLTRFMYGRYGVDKLFYALVVLYFILTGINSFLRLWPIYLVGLAVIGFALFGVLSRSIYKRQREGQAFEKQWNKIKTKCRLYKRGSRTGKPCFRKCPRCKAMLSAEKEGAHGGMSEMQARISHPRVVLGRIYRASDSCQHPTPALAGVFYLYSTLSWIPPCQSCHRAVHD